MAAAKAGISSSVGYGALLLVKTNGNGLIAKFILKCFHCGQCDNVLIC